MFRALGFQFEIWGSVVLDLRIYLDFAESLRNPFFKGSLRKTEDGALLGGPWNLVTTYNWADNHPKNALKWAYGGYPNYK